jgi:arabinan endo-1,5-alpha-L-arabinosidase
LPRGSDQQHAHPRDYRSWLAALLAAALSSCAISPEGDASRIYANPVLERDFADPAVLRDADGWFYAYATQSHSADAVWNVQVARSRDLVRWEHLGEALPGRPHWAATKRAIWAPHVIRDAGRRRYVMYYSAEPDHAKGKCLAVATADAPAGPFADAGAPLLCGESIEHIDPMAFDDPQTGKRLLYWGSGRKPIRVQELAEDRLGFLPGSAPLEILFPGGDGYRSLIEGAWVTFRDGTYFLFYSGDRCCSREPRYAVMVARSTSALGPFEERPEPILEAGNGWLAPGHNSVATDDEGNDWMLYHAIREAPARLLLLDRIEYREGWPRIAGDRPSTSAAEPVIKGPGAP